MPHKFNTDRRGKIPKQKHRVSNWAKYNEGLRRRGDLTFWISEEVLTLWSAPRRTTQGGQPRYSDLAIELCLTLGMLFKQPLRQTQGLMRSMEKLLPKIQNLRTESQIRSRSGRWGQETGYVLPN